MHESFFPLLVIFLQNIETATIIYAGALIAEQVSDARLLINRYENHKTCSPQDAAKRIDENSIASIIQNPDETSDSFGKRKLARKRIGDKTLEIVYIKQDEIIVITVYWLEEP